ncbi:orotidine-5'-phosphate decarboxylase [Candidatus Saccharibacteria bacterium]|nr:MAG: orotidine-5'-phosphate decarboxylase [Candidatus Saccharibacteria bacterium]
MKFIDKLQASVVRNDSLVCVGLDSDAAKLPKGVDQLSFNKAIIDATHDLVAAYKPNTAFYEARGAEGITVLKETCEYIHQKAPSVIIILDAKRADIGNTNAGYLQFAYDYLGADSITLHPYLGHEALEPFLARADKGAIVLCRTSNPGAGEFQDQYLDGHKLFEHVACMVAKDWNGNDNCMLVVGATYPDEARAIREAVGDNMWFLVPGVGAQGGDVQKTMEAAQNSRGSGLLINSSRGIIFASSGVDYAEAARQATITLRSEVNSYRKGK